MSDQPIFYKVNERVATITLNRPQFKNALNQAGLDALTARIDEARTDERAWILVINAAGRDFCVGQDVKELSERGNRGDYFEPVFAALKRTYKPVVCAVQGLCLAGGAGIALGSDIRIVARSARFGWPHAKIGLASIGGPSTLARMIPANLALELMFTGEFIDAERVAALGLANYVVADDALETKTREMVEKVLENAPLAIRAMKESVLTTLHMPYMDAVKRAHAILDGLMQTHDAKEGLRAFVEKRAPKWEAR